MSRSNIRSIIVKSLEDLPQGKTDWNRVRQMTEEEAYRNAMDDPDALPVEDGVKPILNVKLIRARLGMTQEEFAGNFQLSLASIRDWEQGRSQPDQAARTLLKVIERNPDAVKNALKIA